MDRKFVATGSVFLLLGIILGAFGAHGLKDLLKDDIKILEKIASFETGVRYQMYSGFTFLIIGLNSTKLKFPLGTIYGFWLFGTILFSVSIYFLAIQSVLGVSLTFLGPVTPMGGLLLILGWVMFLKFILQKNEL